jgi:hypothetical protein
MTMRMMKRRATTSSVKLEYLSLSFAFIPHNENLHSDYEVLTSSYGAAVLPYVLVYMS